MTDLELARRADDQALTVLSLLVVLSLLASVACVSNSKVVFPVSMVRLLADPEAYSGSRVGTFGYLTIEHGGPLLFLTRDHAGVGDFQSAIELPAELSDALEPCLNGYVRVVGRFVYDKYRGSELIELLAVNERDAGRRDVCVDEPW